MMEWTNSTFFSFTNMLLDEMCHGWRVYDILTQKWILMKHNLFGSCYKTRYLVWEVNNKSTH